MVEEVTSQEQYQPVVSRIRSQRSDISLERNIVASSGHKGESDCCPTLSNKPDTPPWLGDEMSQERPQPLESRMRSQRSDMRAEENSVASSGRRGGESDRRSTPTTARLTRRPWLGDGVFQEQPKPVVKSPTPLSQKSDTKPVGNAGASSEHRGGSDHCSTPTWADTPVVATEEVPSGEVPLHEVLSQEQSKPTVNPSTPPSQNSHLNSGGNAGGSSDHRGRSGRCCSTPTMADIPCGYGKVTSQGQPIPVSVSRIRSLQRSDTNSGGDVGADSGHRGGGNLYSTLTGVDTSRC